MKGHHDAEFVSKPSGRAGNTNAALDAHTNSAPNSAGSTVGRSRFVLVTQN